MLAVIRSVTVKNYTPLCEILYSLLPSKLYVNTAIPRTIFGEEYRSLSSSLCSFLYSPITLSLLGPNILLNTVFSNTVSLRSSLNIQAKNDLRGARYCTNIDIQLCVQESEILMETQLFSIVLHKTAIYLYLMQLSCNPRINIPKSTLVVYIYIQISRMVSSPDVFRPKFLLRDLYFLSV